jgi:predicted nucleic acid-binding protein
LLIGFKSKQSDYKLFSLLNSELDAGEAEALILAMELNADLILLDDKEARVKA